MKPSGSNPEFGPSGIDYRSVPSTYGPGIGVSDTSLSVERGEDPYRRIHAPDAQFSQNETREPLEGADMLRRSPRRRIEILPHNNTESELPTPREEVAETPDIPVPTGTPTYVQDELPFDFGVVKPSEVIERSPSTEIAIRNENVMEPVETVIGELVEDNALAVRETEIPEEIKAAQMEKTIKGLAEAAEQHPRLVQRYEDLWKEFTTTLGHTPIHQIEVRDLDTWDFTITWHMDVAQESPELDYANRAVYRAVRASVNGREDFDYLPTEAFEAIKWLAQEPGTTSGDIKGVLLLGVKPDRISWGQYAYNIDRLSSSLSAVLAESAKKIDIADYKKTVVADSENNDPEEGYWIYDSENNTRREIDNPATLTTRMPEDLRPFTPNNLPKLKDSYDAPYIIARTMRKLQQEAVGKQIQDAYFRKLKNPTLDAMDRKPIDHTAFPSDDEIREILGLDHNFLLFQAARVEGLEKLNTTLARTGRFVPRSFRR